VQRTNDPPATELLIMLLNGTSEGSAARISRVGASNFGLTSTKYSSPSKGKRTTSSGSADLNRSAHAVNRLVAPLPVLRVPEHVHGIRSTWLVLDQAATVNPCRVIYMRHLSFTPVFNICARGLRRTEPVQSRPEALVQCCPHDSRSRTPHSAARRTRARLVSAALQIACSLPNMLLRHLLRSCPCHCRVAGPCATAAKCRRRVGGATERGPQVLRCQCSCYWARG
jgi:hypothetical protein